MVWGTLWAWSSFRQANSCFYSEFGKWAFITPIIAMVLMGLCIYYSVEYTRLTKAKILEN